MTHKIYISDQGELLLIDAPEKPAFSALELLSPAVDTDRAIINYKAALASAIKEGIKFKEPHYETKEILWEKVFRPLDVQSTQQVAGQIFPLPTGYKVSFEDIGKCRALVDDSDHCYCSDGCKEIVAILSPTPAAEKRTDCCGKGGQIDGTFHCDRGECIHAKDNLGGRSKSK